jgi:uncharacterized damage-inducible protein DinB
MPLNKQQLIEKLIEARAYLDRVLDAVGERWDAQVYSDGLQWTARQVAVHIAEADRGHNRQLMGIAEGQEVIPPDFDVERYNQRTTEKTTEKTAAQAREELRASRAALMAWLTDLDDAKLDVVGRHASLRMMSVRDILRMMTLHEKDHANDIVKALGLTV